MCDAPHDPVATWKGDPSHFRRPSRREFLYTGLIGGIGLTLGDFLRLEAFAAQQNPGKQAPAQSVIHIFLPGGIAAQESFDPKPLAPLEYRGPFGTIPTRLKGERFSELLPRTARIADKLTIIRSMTHTEAAHERGTHNMFTGYRPSPAIQYPSMGSVVSHELGPRRDLPAYVAIPTVPNEFAGSGYLSTAYGPFALGSDPARRDFRVRDLSLPNGITDERFQRRRSLLETVDEHFHMLESSDAIDSMDAFYQRAYKMISSEHAREAFNIESEPEALREAYGRNPAGQRMLMARRLVEAGVRFVSMTYGGWDHHANIREGVQNQLPPFDQAYAALITDLERRGMLDRTLVLLTTEFGRTPRINADAGRDHFPRAFSVVLAGGGVHKGLVYGRSNATLTAVEENPVTVADFARTVFHQIGIDPDKELLAPGARPIRIVDGGNLVRDILA